MGLPSKNDIKWETLLNEFITYISNNPCDNTLLHADSKLNNWCTLQRSLYCQNRLAKERVSKLINSGFFFDVSRARFTNRINQLTEYYAINGNYRVTSKDNGTWPGLHAWLEKIIISFNKGELSEEDLSLLNKLDIEWISSAERERWEHMFERLKLFIADNKDVTPVRGSTLYTWCHDQRLSYKKGELLQFQTTKLEAIGFDFNFNFTPKKTLHDQNWDAYIVKVKEFFKKHGHYNFGAIKKDTAKSLAKWQYSVHLRVKRNELTEERLAELNTLEGFLNITTQDVNWNSRFQELSDYIKNNPDDKKAKSANKTLTRWIGRQKKQFQENSLPSQRKNRLKSIGFDFSNADDLWLKKFNEYAALLKGNPNIKPKVSDALRAWLGDQKKNFYLGKLSENRTMLLDSLNIKWNYKPKKLNAADYQIRHKKFITRINQLKDFHKTYGHFLVATTHNAEWPGLYKWLYRQKDKFCKGLLFETEIDILTGIGFDLQQKSTYDNQWDEIIIKAKEFFTKNGHYNFSSVKSKEAKVLATWSSNLRRRIRKNIISPKKIIQLNEMGIDITTSTHKDQWNSKLQELSDYIAKNPNDGKATQANKSLKKWAWMQLHSYNLKTLSDKKIKALTNIGFDLKLAHKTCFSGQLNKLKEFHSIYGHCRVDKKNGAKWPGLAGWVPHCRMKLKQGSLPKNEFLELEKLGFDWSLTD